MNYVEFDCLFGYCNNCCTRICVANFSYFPYGFFAVHLQKFTLHIIILFVRAPHSPGRWEKTENKIKFCN